MDVGPVLLAHGEPFERVRPGERALHDPADRLPPAAGDAAVGVHRPDAALLDQSPVLVVVIAPIVRPRHRGRRRGPAGLAPQRRDTVQQRQKLGMSLRLPLVSVTASGMP